MPNYRRMIGECLDDMNEASLRKILTLVLKDVPAPATVSVPGPSVTPVNFADKVIEKQKSREASYRGEIKVNKTQYKNINQFCKAHQLDPTTVYRKIKGMTNPEAERFLAEYLLTKRRRRKKVESRPPERRLLNSLDGRLVAQ